MENMYEIHWSFFFFAVIGDWELLHCNVGEPMKDYVVFFFLNLPFTYEFIINIKIYSSEEDTGQWAAIQHTLLEVLIMSLTIYLDQIIFQLAYIYKYPKMFLKNVIFYASFDNN